MDGFRYSKSQTTTGTNWNLLPKPRARAMSSTVDTHLLPVLSDYTPSGDSTLEGTQPPSPPSPGVEPPASPPDDSPGSPDGWSKRQLSCPSKSTDSAEFLGFSQDADGATAKEEESEKMPARDGRSSPEPNCSICLEKVVNRSFTNGCLHTFCFSCLVQWSKIKAECPLCKQSFKSIIHNVQENNKYDEYHVVTPMPAVDRNEFSEFRDFITALEVSLPSFRDQGRFGQPFRYSTTVTSDRQRIVYSSTSPWVIPTAAGVPDRWQRFGFAFRHSRRTNFRKNVYTRDLWVIPPMDVTGRYRECTPEFFRQNPALVHRLAPWLNRELNALINNNLTSVVLDVILNAVTRYDITSPEFHRLILPHLNDRTNHFIHEFFSFARSPFDMIGYDQALTYGPNPNRAAMHVVVSDDSSSDSDVLIIPSVAGPSGVNARPAATRISDQPQPDADDSDDCQVVQCIKPRHERTPEIIDLLSDDEAPVVKPADPEPVAVTDDSVSTQSIVESVSSEYLPNKKGKSKKRTRENSSKPFKKRHCCHFADFDDSDSSQSFPDTTALESFLLGKKIKSKKSSKDADVKKPSSKSSKHATDTKSCVTKKEKSLKRKSTIIISESDSSDDGLKVLAKRMQSTDRHKSRKVIYSSDEAGPSTSYRNHLRSGNRPLASYYQPDTSSSPNSADPRSINLRGELGSNGIEHSSPINNSYNLLFSGTSDDASANTYLPFPLHEQSGPGFYTDSGNSFYGFSSQPDHRSSSPLPPFVNCEPIHSRSSVATASTSSAYRTASEPQATHSSPLSPPDGSTPHASPLSFYSNMANVFDTNLPSTSGINQVQSVKKSKRKPIVQLENSVDRKRSRKKKSKSEHSCKKVHLPRHSSSPESSSVQSWMIKPGHGDEEQPSLPDTSVHSSPMTDASEVRPRLKSIIIARQNLPSFSHSASSSSYSSRHSRRKHKHKRLTDNKASSSDTDEW